MVLKFNLLSLICKIKGIGLNNVAGFNQTGKYNGGRWSNAGYVNVAGFNQTGKYNTERALYYSKENVAGFNQTGKYNLIGTLW